MNVLIWGLGMLLAVWARAGEALPGYCPIPANPGFRFSHGVGVNNGEAAPIERAYWLAEFPVTNDEYARCVQLTNSPVRPPKFWRRGKPRAGTGRHPVTGVTYAAACAYCDWLGTLNTNWVFRLPTEAEWEWAASGPNKRTYPWGNPPELRYSPKRNVLQTRFNYRGVSAAALLTDSSITNALYVFPATEMYGKTVPLRSLLSISQKGVVDGWRDTAQRTGLVYTDIYREMTRVGGRTTPVDAYPNNVSAFGCRDMSGNCWEWTSSVINAQSGVKRGLPAQAVRGGAWDSDAQSCKATFRGEGRQKEGAFATVGFRVAAEPRR
ncbi:MAG: formylglycine-generating enzyme family protein [Kiritimatiellae bacterium]|nr:formylglycine-generating enzyme family protein [Kiritimatiellia bacterium]